MSLGLGLALSAKKLSARGWSAVEAEPKQKPVITPEGSMAARTQKPSYHPMLLDHPMWASPANQPCPRRFASRTGIAELSSAWGRHEPYPQASSPASRRSPRWSAYRGARED